MEILSGMGTTKSVLSTVGSTVAAVMVARSIINDFLPREVHDYLYSAVRSFFNHRFSSDMTIIVDEFDGLETNQIFDAAQVYLGTLTKSTGATTSAAAAGHRIRVSKPESEDTIRVNVDRNEEVVDRFNGVVFRWVLHCHQVEAKSFYNNRDVNSTLRSEVRSFYLTFPKKAKTVAMETYLPHILREAHALKQGEKTLKLHTVDFNNMRVYPCRDVWSSVSLNHPATFQTLAMDPDLKRVIMEDLERFVTRKEYYRRVGKAWKRGYLLYGPPGTGKSSLIAAMANYLKFDVYDLELSGLRTDSDLRRLLLCTGNRSILVVEDIDCSVELNDRGSADAAAVARLRRGYYDESRQVTLSGVLNCIDGLWSSCGDERIIIFTTNHKDKLDPALIRPGRMDMHIHMSYCTPCAFRILANNYLGIEHHQLFGDIERLIDDVQVTPAEVAEQLMKHEEDPDPALGALLDFLTLKRIQDEEAKKAKKDKEDEEAKSKESDENGVGVGGESITELGKIGEEI
uniref:Adenosinetriphosphatase n=1 Tax=Opuntia streptacantha TaxID=393608 RepID=A0A7C9ABT4_OPUST